MSPPYRPPPQVPQPLDPQLAQLVASGQQAQQLQYRQSQAAQAFATLEAAAAADRQVRLGLGALRGSPSRRWLLAAALLLLVVFPVVAFTTDLPTEWKLYSIIGAILGFVLVIFAAVAQPMASRAMVRREVERVRRLPYPLEGLFETLGLTPHAVRFELHFDPSRPPPDPALVHAAFCAIDAASRLESAQAHTVIVSSGPIYRYNRGFSTGSRYNRSNQVDDRNVGLRTLGLVDGVLPPLHAGFRLQHVRVSPVYGQPGMATGAEIMKLFGR